jgi:choline dehydrogenase-like flavoprotein
MKRALVIGSGAGGATAAKELQGAFDVTVLEAGEAFRPLSLSLRTLEGLKSTRLLFDERLIHFPFPAMQIRKTPDMVLVNGIGTGGSTAICCGNAVRMDQDPHLHGASEGLAQTHQAALPDISGDGPAADAHAQDG